MTYRTLLEAIIRNGDLNGLQAKKVADYYRKQRLVRYNAHDGYQVVHGALLDRDVIRRALGVTHGQA